MEHFNNINNKNIVLFQGPVGCFFNELEELFIKNNNTTSRFIFNKSDEYFSNSLNEIKYLDGIDKWNDYIYNFFNNENIEIIILFNDLRPFHKIAISIALKLNIEVFVFEQGYLRNGFITFERNGVNTNSITIPKSRLIYEKMNFKYSYKHNINKEQKEIKSNYYKLVKYIVIYGVLNKFFNSKYKLNNNNSYYKYDIIKDGLKWIYSRSLKFVFKKKTLKQINFLKNHKKNKYFLIPLQLNNDTQLLFNSPFNDINEFIFTTIQSFAKFSNKDEYLVFKVHPLNPDLMEFNNYIKTLSKKYHILDRVIYLNSGDLGVLIKNSKGVVTINSTVGISCVFHLHPLKVLGNAIFDIDGISYQGNLDDFWVDDFKPEYQIVSNFLNYILYYTQLSGSFYVENTIITK